MNLYKINFTWYDDDISEDEVKEVAFTFANSCTEVIQKLEQSYAEITSITIEIVDFDVSFDIFYIPHKDVMTIEDLINENHY